MGFKEWLLSEMRSSSGKTVFYPPGANGVGLYPPAAYLAGAADAIYYMSIDDRIFKNSEWKIKHIAGAPSHNNMPSGEGSPWKISHIAGKPSAAKSGGLAMSLGDKGPFDISHIKGKPNAQTLGDFGLKSGEGHPFSIKHL